MWCVKQVSPKNVAGRVLRIDTPLMSFGRREQTTITLHGVHERPNGCGRGWTDGASGRSENNTVSDIQFPIRCVR